MQKTQAIIGRDREKTRQRIIEREHPTRRDRES